MTVFGWLLILAPLAALLILATIDRITDDRDQR